MFKIKFYWREITIIKKNTLFLYVLKYLALEHPEFYVEIHYKIH